jgi:hypothetical protein
MKTKTQKISILLMTLLMEILFTALLTVIIVVIVGYVSVNIVFFDNFSIVGFANGWERFWIFLYFLSDVLYFVLLSLIFFEAALFAVRQIFIRAIKAIEKIQDKDFEKAQTVIKSVSLVTMFKWMKIDTMKRSIITYLIVIALVLGSGWLSKAVLKANDSPVYRAYEVLNLYSDDTIYDFTDELSDEQTYDITISSGVGNIHIYTVANSNEAKFYYLYDTEAQLTAYDLSVDKETDTITILINEDQTAYERYVDPVLPSLEIYLPSSIHIGTITVDIASYGALTMEYLAFAALKVDAKNADLSIKAQDLSVGSIDISQTNGNLILNVDDAESVTLDLDTIDASIRLADIAMAMALTVNKANIFLYQTVAAGIDITATDSQLELREVVSGDTSIDLLRSNLLYVNTSGENQSIATIHSIDSVMTLRGVENAAEGE